MPPHQRGRSLHDEPLCRADILKLYKGVIIMAVSIGDHQYTGRLISANFGKPLRRQNREPAAVDGHTEDHEIFPGKLYLREGSVFAASFPSRQIHSLKSLIQSFRHGFHTLSDTADTAAALGRNMVLFTLAANLLLIWRIFRKDKGDRRKA